jgi:hypothetical protein
MSFAKNSNNLRALSYSGENSSQKKASSKTKGKLEYYRLGKRIG